MKRILLLSLFIFIHYLSFSQMDTLVNKLDRVDSFDKVDLLNKISFLYWNKNPSKGYEYGMQAKELAESLHYKRGLGDAYNAIGVNLWVVGSLDDALQQYFLANKIYKEIKDTARVSAVLNNIAIINKRIGKYSESVKIFQESIDLNKKIGRDRDNVSIYSNIGLIHLKLKEYDKAVNNFNKSLKLAQDYKDTLVISQALHNLSSSYANQGLNKKALKISQEAIFYKRRCGDKIGLVRTLHQSANLNMNLKKLRVANRNILEARNISQKLNIRSELLTNYLLSAYLYKKYGNYKKAYKFFLKKDSIASVINLKNQKMKIQREKYARTKQEHEKKIKALKDDYITNKNKLIKAEENNKFVVLVSFVFLCLIITLFGLYSTIQKKNRALLDKNQTVTRSKELLDNVIIQKDRFLSIIAHDLRNPFNSILGLSNILLEDFDEIDDDEKKKMLTLIVSSSNNSLKLLEELLLWAKSAVNFKLKIENVDVKKFIEETFAGLNSQAINKKIKLEYSVDSRNKARFGTFSMSIILTNLISNSIKFSYPESKIHLNFSRINETKESCFTITDSGVGMNAEQVKNLFNVLNVKSTIGTNKEKGSGLGLVVCQSFIKKYDGRIEVESKEGEGSIFKVIFPENPVQKDVMI
ncbi:sensor histidine kinase [Marinilabiliaceae bacterium JC040]|nr:sensor histidine kinase [Marinilabiliaceae bacterium JC040]